LGDQGLELRIGAKGFELLVGGELSRVGKAGLDGAAEMGEGLTSLAG